MTSYAVSAVAGLGEVTAGADLARLVCEQERLLDGDILVVTSKVVSKAEGRVMAGDRDTWLPAETDRLVAQRGPTSIVRTHHGLVMAAAGIDASNCAPGTVVLLPPHPDASARSLRERVQEYADVDIGVVVSDTSGRAWRNGQTDVAIGAAGLLVLDDHAGRVDGYGNPLAVTAPALADEIAGVGDLAKGKLGGTPVALVRGLGHLVLPGGEHGTGAAALIRDEAQDLFGYGARDAVRQALGLGASDDPGRGFGAPASAEELAGALSGLAPGTAEVSGELVLVNLPELDARARGRLEVRLETLAAAYGWQGGWEGGWPDSSSAAGEPGCFRPRTP